MKGLLKVNLGRFLGESSSVYIPQEINVEPQGNNKGTKCDTRSLEKTTWSAYKSHANLGAQRQQWYRVRLKTQLVGTFIQADKTMIAIAGKSGKEKNKFCKWLLWPSPLNASERTSEQVLSCSLEGRSI